MLKLKMMGSMLGGNDAAEGLGGFGSNGLAMMMLMGNGSMDGIFDGFGDDDDDEDDEGSPLDGIFGDDEEPEEKPSKKSAYIAAGITADKAVRGSAKKAVRKPVKKARR